MVDTTTYPARTVVRISAYIGEQQYLGSGVLISPDEVLTAAHVVWRKDLGLATGVVVTPGLSGDSTPFGAFDGVVTHYNPIQDVDGLILRSEMQSDFAVIHLNRSTTLGYLPLGADYMGGNVTVSGYPGYSGVQVNSVQSVSRDPVYNNLLGDSLGGGSSGGPVWINADGPRVVGTISAQDSSNVGYFTRLTADSRDTILSWVAQDDGYSLLAGYINTSTGQQGTAPFVPASGGPSYLQWQYIWSGADGVSLSSSAPDVFLHGGPGQDSIQVTAGRNVLDGGAGSNFLTGGTGTDTFFTDARGSGVVWNTLRNFHAGDAATLWGFVPGVSTYWWEADVAGAPGSTGATLRANIVGGQGRAGDGIDASITFAGLSVAQAKSLQVTAGTQQAGPYLYFSNANA